MVIIAVAIPLVRLRVKQWIGDRRKAPTLQIKNFKFLGLVCDLKIGI